MKPQGDSYLTADRNKNIFLLILDVCQDAMAAAVGLAGNNRKCKGSGMHPNDVAAFALCT